MSLNRISAAEAASLIKHGYNIGLSGFTPAGTAKAVTAELAKIAEAEHAKGNPFQVGIFTGASTGESCDGVLSRAKAIRYRAPYTTNADFRKAVNNGEIAAVVLDDEATLKRLYYYPTEQKLVLSPENPAYEPLVFTGEELNHVHILGRAVAVQGRLR